ncbi:MAG: 4Fe-4S dicluster domain-containing protein [Dehalococcoidales bacterium]|nr:4Fe-4S dicluster domain-containing protein [Dehalococcoidales bacterium]
MARWAMVIDLRRCVGCQACTLACQMNNDLPLGMFWNIVTTTSTKGSFPNINYNHLPRPCFHCEEPPCVDCCPTGASTKSKDGIVTVNPDTCIGCGACIVACPYGARTKNKNLGIVQKCTFCEDIIYEGKEPYCVASCHQRARIFGDISDPESEVYQLVNKENAVQIMPELGTDPHVYYIQS